MKNQELTVLWRKFGKKIFLRPCSHPPQLFANKYLLSSVLSFANEPITQSSVIACKIPNDSMQRTFSLRNLLRNIRCIRSVFVYFFLCFVVKIHCKLDCNSPNVQLLGLDKIVTSIEHGDGFVLCYVWDGFVKTVDFFRNKLLNRLKYHQKNV